MYSKDDSRHQESSRNSIGNPESLILGQTKHACHTVLWNESVARYRARLKGWLDASVGVLTNLRLEFHTRVQRALFFHPGI